MTSSNGNIFRVTGPLWGEFTGEFPSQRPVTRSFDVFFALRLNKRLNKHSRRWWFETPWHPLWRHCDDNHTARALLWFCKINAIMSHGVRCFTFLVTKLKLSWRTSQCHGSWCPGDLRRQAISSHGIDYAGSACYWLPWWRISASCAKLMFG